MSATMTCSARDIPQSSPGRDSFAAVAARGVPVMKSHPLPTPPNSISPSLPPHGVKPYGTRSTTAQLALEQVDSDLDLQGILDNGDKDTPHNMAHIGSSECDTTASITPALLAKHHLPDILLNHGPLAIRQIMGFLTTAVPGFSGIPPARARRLVVGALEGRGNGGEAGGLKADVKFEKVGWGRWDARLRGHSVRNRRQSPPPSMPSSYSDGMPIANTDVWKYQRTRVEAPGSSWADDSAIFSHDEERDVPMLENEADKMSLDGDEPCSSSDGPGDDDIMLDNPEDLTDDEDWAAVGAAALRAASYPLSGPVPNFLSSPFTGRARGGGPSLSVLAKSMPMNTRQPGFDFSVLGMASDSQERDAVEALLQLGSV